MATSSSRLPGSLELLFTDEPVLDLYARGPWRIPDGLVDDLAGRIDALVADGRSARLTVEKHPFLRSPTPAVVADALAIVRFLFGDLAVRGGSRSGFEEELLGRFRTAGNGPAHGPTRWLAIPAPWRPPGGELFRVAGEDPTLREAAWDLTVEILHALKGISPVDERRRALLGLFERVRADADLTEATLVVPNLRAEWTRIEELWADLAPDETAQLLPELTGPVGYLSWLLDGWLAAHERLLAVVPGLASGTDAFAELVLQAGVTEAPAELAVGVRGDLYDDLDARIAALAPDWRVEDWQRSIRAFLARGLVAGEVVLCRSWLDLAVRLTGALQGVPGSPVAPDPCAVPVGAFQEDLRRLFRVRRIRHPLTVPGTPEPTWFEEPEEEPVVEEEPEVVAEEEPVEPEPEDEDELPETVDPLAGRGQHAGPPAAPEPERPAEAESAPGQHEGPAAEEPEPVVEEEPEPAAEVQVDETSELQVTLPNLAPPVIGPTVRPPAQAPMAVPEQATEPEQTQEVGLDLLPPRSVVEATTLADRIVGQPDLVSALRELAERHEQEVRLLVVGPPGTGMGLTVDVLRKLVVARGFDGSAAWVSYEDYERLGTAAAVTRLQDTVASALGERLVAIAGLDLLVSNALSGRAVADELNRLFEAHGPKLQVAAFCGVDGYRRLVEVDPALAARWRIVRTRDFDARDFATIFGRACEERGAATTASAAVAAGDLLATTPGQRELRNGKLAAYLADLAVDSARRRSRGVEAVVVDVPDLPSLGAPSLPPINPPARPPGPVPGLGGRLT
ncbi:serine/threonine-protein kinase [Tenggerimyces flavus]|uniref:ATP-binding protein n=1 Tax=Tenggerimyces flavus TaxID=1708749 RepID=A0ABV7Y8N7_9ACTN|nr:hypothetical protein [Tenggerimyces flavus]MBM7791121.1 hypothetical protein [Tenggerimyces flavus]